MESVRALRLDIPKHILFSTISSDLCEIYTAHNTIDGVTDTSVFYYSEDDCPAKEMMKKDRVIKLLFKRVDKNYDEYASFSKRVKADLNIEKVFVQRANEMRNPLSGQELLNESVRLLMDLRVEEEIVENREES